ENHESKYLITLLHELDYWIINGALPVVLTN
ncbi:MAG: hypothetical protein ACI90V_004818, partial [Bacillariaceae sp.]